MPTLSALAGICAVANTCGVETGSAICPVVAVASVTGDSEVAAWEQVAPVSAPTVSAYV